ncbi:MAG TPA: polysialyltransferase family glycosyltransferase [Bacteroidia bacterium]|jgi:hypothetical protein|nr:polysialyltransferase family glycosyltransferase [Bacteroidia bacterium]
MKILAIIDPHRTDLYYYLKNDKENDYVLLWYENKDQLTGTDFRASGFFKEEYYWNKFRTPKKLIETIKPDKIVFQQIIDQRQIGLLVCAYKCGITTFFLDHGAAGDKETAVIRSTEKDYNFKSRFSHFFSKLNKSLIHVTKVKYYYYSNLFRLGSLISTLSYLKLPLLMLKYQPTKALNICTFRERVPKYSIVFSRSNFKEYQLYTGANESDVIFTGVPSFDHFYRNEIKTGDHVVYIEHPMFEEKLLNWSSKHHKKIAHFLFDFANSKKVLIYIKLHPRSDIELWRSYHLNSPYFKIIQEGDYTELYLSSKLILGYSSSLLTGFICAKKNVVNIGWHPEPRIYGVDFAKYGLCHQSLNILDMETKFDSWVSVNLCLNHETEYQKFILDFNYPFDGKATERIIKTIADA